MSGDGDLGVLLRGYRQRALLTQEELAARTGLSTRTVRRLESDQMRRPRTATVRMLAAALGLNDTEQAALVATTNNGSRGELALGGPDELPADIADFTGRSDTVAAVSAVLTGPLPGNPAAARVVNVCGPPGVGKTTLAIHVGHLLRSQFPDGRLYVELRGTANRPLSPEDALDRLLRRSVAAEEALPDTVEERAALLRSRLAGRRILVLLDDAWSEAQVRPLLPGGGGCAVLITSRRPLAALDGPHRVDLDVFRTDEAIDLLARILRPGPVTFDPAIAAEIAMLCGDLPLAVRIAGAQLTTHPHWTLRRMADQLADEHRLDTLAVGDRAIRRSIGTSYRALDDLARRLFRLLGTLTETDVPAWVAAAILDQPESYPDGLLDDLVNAQLLRVDQQGRYRMHSLVRLYAREACQVEESDVDRTDAAQRMAGGWLNLVERAQAGLPGGLPRIGSGDGPRWPAPAAVAENATARPIDWFDTECLPLVSAVHIAATLGLDELVWDLAGCASRFLEMRAYFDLWQTVLQHALAAVRDAGNQRGEAHLLRIYAEFWLDRDDYPRALECLDQATRIFHELGERLAEGHTQRAIGMVLRMRGDNAAATARLEVALAVFTAADDRTGLAETLFSLGALRRYQGRNDDALRCYRRAYTLERELGNRFNQSLLLCSIGSALVAQRQIDEARTVLTRGLSLAREIQEGEAFALAFLGEAEILAGHLDTANEHLTAALDSFQRVGDRYGEAVALRNLGDLYRIRGAFEPARSTLDRALRIWDDLDAPHWRARTLLTLGSLYRESGDRAAALASWRAAAELFERLGTAEVDQVRDLLRDYG